MQVQAIYHLLWQKDQLYALLQGHSDLKSDYFPEKTLWLALLLLVNFLIVSKLQLQIIGLVNIQALNVKMQ